MSLLDDLRDLASTLPGDVKPVASEIVDVVAAIVATLEHHDLTPPPATAAETDSVERQAAVDDGTEGSMVYDAANAAAPSSETAESPAPPAADPITPGPVAGDPEVSADELEREIRERSDELQALQVKLAAAQRTTASSDGS